MPRKKSETHSELTARLAERIGGLLKSRGVSQRALADYIGITAQAVSLYANGATAPDIDALIKMAQFFNVSTDYLLGLSDAETASIEERAICDYTGLSADSIEALHKISHGYRNFTKNEKARFFIDAALSSENLVFDQMGDGSVSYPTFFADLYLLIFPVEKGKEKVRLFPAGQEGMFLEDYNLFIATDAANEFITCLRSKYNPELLYRQTTKHLSIENAEQFIQEYEALENLPDPEESEL